MSSIPPIFVLAEAAFPNPNAPFLAGIAAAAGVPNTNAVIMLQHSALLEKDFSVAQAAKAMFPPTALLRFNIAGGFCVPNTRYRTVTLPISLYGGTPVPLCSAATWDEAFQADFIQAVANLIEWCQQTGIWERVHGISFAPNNRSPYDPECGIPSTNPPPWNDDFTAAWDAIGYSEDNYVQGLGNIAGGVLPLVAGLKNCFYMLAPQSQKIGFLPDKTASFATRQMQTMVAAAPDVWFGPNMDSLDSTTTTANWAIATGIASGRLGIQLSNKPRSPTDIAAALQLAASFGASWIECHYFQASLIYAYYNQVSLAPIISFGGNLLSFAGKILTANPA